MDIVLHPIQKDGSIKGIPVENESLQNVLPQTVEFYKKVGFVEPWISYVALLQDKPVGVCAFKSPPVAGRVEIAYFTFPEFQNKGIGTEMAKSLIKIAKEKDSEICLVAQTLPQKNASTSILEKLHFIKTKEFIHPEDGKIWEWELPRSGQ